MLVKYPDTPGVKVIEKSLLPPSIAQVSTAVPVFLGYTAKGTAKEPVRISSLKEFEDIFGGPFQHDFQLDNSLVVDPAHTKTLDYVFYECIQLYFINGGGACYILPVGNHPPTNTNSMSKSDFINALPEVETLDEPTLIAFPEATKFNTSTTYGDIANAALTVANNTKDKFILIDSPNGKKLIGPSNNSTDLRGQLIGNLSYGAVYYPHLLVSINFSVDESKSEMATGTGSTLKTLEALKTDGDINYGKALEAIKTSFKMTLPPSSLMAGVYAKNDREKGFWKAPANIALQGVIQPKDAISDESQENLNVDADTGKSINAIRSFAGKGTLVWGARTLDGNSNEWRYISVRRLFMTVEESVKKATTQFVFENNDSKTWVKVNAMISAYLDGLWRDGALMGATPQEAYFVQIGLGTTMTEQDILAGEMIISIGVAAVRPAEFITLKFSHKMQEQ